MPRDMRRREMRVVGIVGSIRRCFSSQLVAPGAFHLPMSGRRTGRRVPSIHRCLGVGFISGPVGPAAVAAF